MNDARRLDWSLNQVQPHLPPTLVPAESLERIRGVARILPLYAVDFFGFECRLSEGVNPTDCALNLTPEGARLLAGRGTSDAPAELRGGAWDRLERFYQQWGDTRRPAYCDAPATWLEFDMSSGTPSPNLLFGYWPGQRDDIDRPLEWLVDDVIPMLLGFPLSPAFRANIVRCFEERPSETEDFQIGLMIARNFPAVRVCVFDIPIAVLASYLERIGWHGPLDELQGWMDAFRPHSDFIGLHFDVGEKVFPHIGVEPGFRASSWSRQPHLEPRWHGLFDRLGERGLLAREKKDALLQWIGYQNITLDEQPALLLRGLSHLKLVLRPGAAPQAKAYFGIAHRLLGAAAASA